MGWVQKHLAYSVHLITEIAISGMLWCHSNVDNVGEMIRLKGILECH